MSIYELETDPENENIFEAIGVSNEDAKRCLQELEKLQHEHKTKTATMNAYIQNIHEDEVKHRFLIGMAIVGIDSAMDMDPLTMMMRMMRRRGRLIDTKEISFPRTMGVFSL
jgi:hypothetical protein